MALFGGFGAAAPVGPRDVECPMPAAADSTSTVSWSPVSNHLAAGGWDGTVRIFDVGRSADSSKAVSASQVAEQKFAAPVLDSSWREDGTGVFVAACDNTVKLWSLNGNAVTDIGSHDAPIKSCFWIKEAQMLITGGWDRHICVWDGRVATPQMRIPLSERIWSMDVKWPLLIAVTADKQIYIFNLQSPEKPFRVMASPLAFQTRCVRAFHDQKTFALGSVEGRVSVRYVDGPTDTETEAANKDRLKWSFSFRCHRQGALVYPVNCIDTHPAPGYQDVFSTAGSDGTIVMWNKAKKLKHSEYAPCKQRNCVSAAAWNPAGDLFAYACSYDWYKGVEGYSPGTVPNQLFVHNTTQEDMQGAPPAAGR